MNIYTFADIMTCVVESIMLFVLMDTFCDKRERIPRWGYWLGGAVLAVLIRVSNLLFQFQLLNALCMILCAFAMSALYRGKLSMKAILPVMCFTVNGGIEVLVTFCIAAFFGATVTETVHDPNLRLLGIVVSKTLSLMFVTILHVKLKRRDMRRGTSYWILFLLIFVGSNLAIFSLFKLAYELKETHMYTFCAISSFGLLFGSFFALYLYEHMATQAEVISRQQQVEQHYQSQLKHMDEILITQNQIKKFKHDVSNHLTALSGYFEKSDYAGGINYIQSLNGGIDSRQNAVETGNTALDAVLNSKKDLAEAKQINFVTNIQIPEELQADAPDLCVIFGNALDNAIEACEKLTEGERTISLSMIGKADSVFCKVVNTAPKPRKHFSQTTKDDRKNHGFGLQNIRTVLEKYNSIPTITQTDTEFTLKFVLFTKENAHENSDM